MVAITPVGDDMNISGCLKNWAIFSNNSGAIVRPPVNNLVSLTKIILNKNSKLPQNPTIVGRKLQTNLQNYTSQLQQIVLL